MVPLLKNEDITKIHQKPRIAIQVACLVGVVAKDKK